MNNCSHLLEQAENLKKELSNGRNGLSSDGSGTGEWISNRTSLQDVYRQLLITNLEYALDKKIEQDLWNFVFKNHITALQQQVKDKSNNFRVEAQSHLTSFLDAASGFYAHLLDDLCTTFQVSIPCRVKSSKLVFLKDASTIKQSSITQPERPSCQYMCQHCLVHLGDIARYRNQNGQAESYYRHAAQLVPSNGQPYNQLAILAAASGDVLSTAFYYCRSLAVKCPFPGSDTNLRRQLSKIMAGDEPRHTKISTSELVKFCLKFHACIYLKTNDDDLSGMADRLAAYIRAHLRAGSLSRQQITHMAFLNLFSLYHLAPNGTDESGQPSESTTECVQQTKSDGTAREKEETEEGNYPWQAMLAFTMQVLAGLLACVPAHSDDAADLVHPALPAIKLVLDWLTTNHTVLNRKEVALSSRVWPRLAKVLNALGNQDKANNMNNKPLPEDLELRGFVGLKQPLSKLDFISGMEGPIPDDNEHACRSYRLYQRGLSIATYNSDLLAFCDDDSGTIFSSSVAPSPQHGVKVNGVEEQSEMEETEKDDEEEQVVRAEEEVEIPPSPPKSSIRKHKEVRVIEPPANSRRGGAKNRGSLKNVEDHQNSSRKKNRAPRMQNVGVQIKPENKLKVIEEEEGMYNGSFSHREDADGERLSNESSQGDGSSPGAGTQPRSGPRVTFATPQMSPTQQLSDEPQSPGAPPSGYVDQMPIMIPGLPMYADPGSRLMQQPYVPNVQLFPQQMGPIYHQAPPGNPMLTGPFASRNVAPYAYPHPGVLSRPHIPVSHFQAMPGQQHVAQSNGTPPHPADLPQPRFPVSRYPHLVTDASNYRPAGPPQLAGSPSDRFGMMERVPSRPKDISYSMQQNAANLSSLSSNTHDISPTQQPRIPTRPLASNPDAEYGFVSPVSNTGHAFSAANRSLLDLQRPRLGFSIRPQPAGSCVVPTSSQQLESHLDSFDMSGIAGDRARSFFHNSLMSPSPGNHPAGGSANTSSTSSPAPGSLSSQMQNVPNTSMSGSLPNNYAGMGLGLGQGLSSMFVGNSATVGNSNVMRPDVLANLNPPRSQPPGFVGSPNQKLTPTAIKTFLEAKQADLYAREAAASMFGIPNNANNSLNDELRRLSQGAVSQSPSTDFSPYALQQARVKALFEDTKANEVAENMKNLSQQAKIQLESLLSKQAEHDKTNLPASLANEEKASYKLFPDTGSAWGIAGGSSGGDGLGLTGLGTIGSERAAAQQTQQQYSPWNGLPVPSSSAASDKPVLSDKGRGDPQLQRSRNQEPGPSGAGNNFASQSFWSTPMVPSGPSALEQLIQQQKQQHRVGHDHSPP